MIDWTDMEIIELLAANSRMQWQEIGKKVHLTGQAVRNRISRLEKLEIIEGYTVRLDREKLGYCLTAYVTLLMKTTDHAAFRKYITGNELVTDAHRISGEGCYIFKVETSNRQSLNELLDDVLKFGNYRLNLSIDKIK